MTSYDASAYYQPRRASYGHPQAGPPNPNYYPEDPTHQRRRQSSATSIPYGPTQPVIVGVPRPSALDARQSLSYSSPPPQPAVAHPGLQQSVSYNGYPTGAQPIYSAAQTYGSSPGSSYGASPTGPGMNAAALGTTPPTFYPTLQVPAQATARRGSAGYAPPPAPAGVQRGSFGYAAPAPDNYSNGFNQSRATNIPADSRAIEDDEDEEEPRPRHHRKHSSTSYRSAERRSSRAVSESDSDSSGDSRRSYKSDRRTRNDEGRYYDSERRRRYSEPSKKKKKQHDYDDRKPTLGDSAFLVWKQLRGFVSSKRD